MRQPGGSSDGAMLRIPADVNELVRVRQFVRDYARGTGADPRTTSDLVQAVDESVCNSIVHGYKGGPGAVEVEVARNGSSIVVHLRDEAPPFDPTTIPPPDVTKPLEEQRMGGLGVLLARELTDSVTYRHTSRGNELTLTKRIGGGTDAEHHR